MSFFFLVFLLFDVMLFVTACLSNGTAGWPAATPDLSMSETLALSSFALSCTS